MAIPSKRGDVVAAVHAAFPAGDRTRILGALDRYGVEPHERERERVQLAIVALSQGSEEKLLQFVQAAKADYRDVLDWQARGPLPLEEGRMLQQAARRLIEQWGKK